MVFTSFEILELNNSVFIKNVKGKKPTDTYKVSLSYKNGYKASGQLTVTGPDVYEKAVRTSEIIWGRLKRYNVEFSDKKTEFLGYSSCHKDVVPLPENTNEIVLRLSVKDNDLNNFHFLGSYPPEDMPAFFASADALLVTLKKSKIFSSTIPGKLQSYLACGKPVIASLDGIGAKIINDSNCGLVSKSEDFHGLAESIITFSKLNNSERKFFGDNGRKYFEKEFEREKLLSKLIDIFDQ